MVYPDNGELLKKMDAGEQIAPPDYRVETYKPHAAEGDEKPFDERLLVKKRADISGNHVSGSSAGYYGNKGWEVQLGFDDEGAKKFGEITSKLTLGHRFRHRARRRDLYGAGINARPYMVEERNHHRDV